LVIVVVIVILVIIIIITIISSHKWEYHNAKLIADRSNPQHFSGRQSSNENALAIKMI